MKLFRRNDVQKTIVGKMLCTQVMVNDKVSRLFYSIVFMWIYIHDQVQINYYTYMSRTEID